MRSRPAVENAFSITALPSGATIASTPERGSNIERSSAIRALRFWHMKLSFGSQAGAAGSNPESPCASAKARSHGMAPPSSTSAASIASADRPFTGKR